jgi:pimeloyl-ACP methyl ester carboxylesterase
MEVAAYTMDLLVGDVLAVMEAAGAERAHVVGHDWALG